MLKQRSAVRLMLLAMCVCAVAMLCPRAQALTYTFVPGGANDWWVPGNWDLAGIPSAVGDIAVFDASANASYSTNTHPSPNPPGATYTVSELRFDTASNWRIYNNERDINLDATSGNALITQNGSGTVTYDRL